MKTATLTVPELGAIAATRGMLAAGAVMLLADRIPDGAKKKIGWPLLAIGVLSTLPLAMRVLKSIKKTEMRAPQVKPRTSRAKPKLNSASAKKSRPKKAAA